MTVNTNIGKITASKDVLNTLSLSLTESAVSLANRGYNARAFAGDYGECEEFMHQQFIEYQEGRIG